MGCKYTYQMKHSRIFFLLLSLLAFSGCEKVPPLSERIAKSWTARVVTWNSTTVYTRGGTSNTTPGYTNYSLQLTTAGNVNLREFTGETFTGKWALEGETTLKITDLSPAPTGTNGQMTFTIDGITDSELRLSATQAYAKTGDQRVAYTLQIQ